MINGFDDLCTAQVLIVKNNGAEIGPVKCSLSNKKATIFDEDLYLEEGDKLIQLLPRDKRISFTILETQFTDRFHGIPAHWGLDIRKDSSLIKEKQSSIVISNSEGIQIGDHNMQDLKKTFAGIVSSIENSNAPEAEKTEAKSRLAAVFANPLLASILGGATGGIIGLLKN